MPVGYVGREERKIFFLWTFKNDFHFRGSVQDSEVEDLNSICDPSVSARPVTDILISPFFLGLHPLPVAEGQPAWEILHLHDNPYSAQRPPLQRYRGDSEGPYGRLKGMGTDLRSLKFVVVTKPSTVRYRKSFSSSGVTNSEVTQGDPLWSYIYKCGIPRPPKKKQIEKEKKRKGCPLRLVSKHHVAPPALDEFLSFAL